MDTGQLLQAIFNRIKRRRLVILLGGVILAILMALYALADNAVYTSKATVFPLTSSSDNALTSGTLSGILGLGETPKSFSNEAAINIIELALSRNVRESVAASHVPSKGNKLVSELLVEEENKHRSFLNSTIVFPQDSLSQVVLGGILLKPDINAKINKNGVLELYFSNTNEGIVQPVSEIIVSKISQFYIDLRIRKALADYTFTLGKIDSIQKVLNGLDNKAIGLQNSTFFTPNRLEYDIPKENLSDEKLRVGRQRDISINNREEALWRLQKVTPIIATLDSPAPPFEVKRSSPVIMGVIGFMLGVFLAILLATTGILYRFGKSEIYKSIFGDKTIVANDI